MTGSSDEKNQPGSDIRSMRNLLEKCCLGLELQCGNGRCQERDRRIKSQINEGTTHPGRASTSKKVIRSQFSFIGFPPQRELAGARFLAVNKMQLKRKNYGVGSTETFLIAPAGERESPVK